MKKLLPLLLVGFLYADNEVYVDQSGNNANIDIEQLGSSNIIGGLNAVSGTMTALDLDGLNLTLDINQIGSSNKFLFDIQVDPTNTYGADSGNYNVDVTGSSNDFDLNVGTGALASTLDLDWIINGDSNTFDFDIDYDLATSYVDVDGDSNSITFDGSGYQNGYFYLDQTGNSRTFNVTQSSTLASDWLKILSNGNNGTVCVVQNDGGTSTSC
jgi:hypothetical protein